MYCCFGTIGRQKGNTNGNNTYICEAYGVAMGGDAGSCDVLHLIIEGLRKAGLDSQVAGIAIASYANPVLVLVLILSYYSHYDISSSIF